MISVLIPVFNFKVTNLVTEIHSQLLVLNIDFEIICIDDASTIYFNENDVIQKLKNVIFVKLEKNIGRSCIRNLLVKKANFNWLLFLDADVMPNKTIFIKNYINKIKNEEAKVYLGGIIYQNKKPNRNKLLRWVYGKKREEVNLSIRKNKPYNYFFGGNFLIHKSVFKTVIFNETIIKYGYEDLFFANNLKKNNIKLIHMDNPIIHLGITTTDAYLINIKHATENLYELNKEGLRLNNSKILNVFRLINKIGLTLIVSKLYSNLSSVLEKNLKSKNPQLYLLDLYKLSYLCYLKKTNRG
jgi:glycosyltransferase involved in cell wall biosynthesis